MSCMRSATLGSALLLATSSMAMAQTVQTRFGLLSTDGMNTLLFKGRPLDPSIQGNNSLSLLQTLQIGTVDEVVVQDNGGTACPAMYYIVTVTSVSATATRAFGTCSDLAVVARTANGVSLTMPAFSTYMQQRSGRVPHGQHVFAVTGGVVTDNGKPLHGPR